jgi:hypothetical protein
MPERKNILCRVNIAVVSNTALTSPFSYSQAYSTFRTVLARAATRAGLGGVSFVDDFKNYASVSAFIFQHCFQGRPASIQNRLGHLGFDQFLTTYVTNENCRISIN